MDIHKPKPFHSVKEFFSEIVVIVVGIGIALSLEQIVEKLHWRHQVEEAEQAMALELSDTYGQLLERKTVYDCVEARLDAVAAVIDAAGESGKLMPLGQIAAPPSRTWIHGAWDSMVAGQTGEHFDAARRTKYAAHYTQVAILGQRGTEESDIWVRLHALVGPGRKTDPSELARYRELVEKARQMNRSFLLVSAYMRQQLDGSIQKDGTTIAQYDRPKDSYNICRPVGPVPEHYGAGRGKDEAEHAIANPYDD